MTSERGKQKIVDSGFMYVEERSVDGRKLFGSVKRGTMDAKRSFTPTPILGRYIAA